MSTHESDSGKRVQCAADGDDFLRGDAVPVALARVLTDPPDVGQSHQPESWDTFTRLAWRPAWSIRSRRGALAPLIQWWRSRRDLTDNNALDNPL